MRSMNEMIRAELDADLAETAGDDIQLLLMALKVQTVRSAICKECLKKIKP